MNPALDVSLASLASIPALTRPLPRLDSAVDDGTGCLECVAWLNSSSDEGGATATAGGGSVAVGDFSIDLRGLRLGALVRIQGRVKEYRERTQCVVNALQLCADPNVESLFWLDHARLGEEIERGWTVGR